MGPPLRDMKARPAAAAEGCGRGGKVLRSSIGDQGSVLYTMGVLESRIGGSVFY